MQMSLMHESLNDALRETVQAIGGTKKVGCMLWPEMTADHASSRLRDCLNPERREKLSPEQVEMLSRMGRQVGCHAIMAHLCRTTGYAEPVPVELAAVWVGLFDVGFSLAKSGRIVSEHAEPTTHRFEVAW